MGEVNVCAPWQKRKERRLPLSKKRKLSPRAPAPATFGLPCSIREQLEDTVCFVHVQDVNSYPDVRCIFHLYLHGLLNVPGSVGHVFSTLR